ncbi:MAG: hypothetical protein B6244_14535 [Candidatus Cloacimonetes bacterium 4572_55]|nr:MAG: hypothetical protein B6244_14535 [Candidatus Cloacimonetes bacterium 4572_55]
MDIRAKIRDERNKCMWLEVYCAGGITAMDTCKDLKISMQRVQRWRDQDAEFAEAYNFVDVTHHEICSKEDTPYIELVGDNHLKLVEKNRDEKYAMDTIEKNIVHKEDIEKLKTKWLKAFEQLYFNIIETCKACGITRSVFNSWLKTSAKFKEAYLEANEAKMDFIESQLMRNIGKGDGPSIIFACKTRLKDRGYIEKQEIKHSGNFGVMVAPGTAKSEEEWGKSAVAQQAQLEAQTSTVEKMRENG